ncbi:MAG: quinol monooxygenase YgiN/uncharacterized glyoxalase superfamily protein PhnB [Crocinitomicaceae bacterium]|jgi:quinol monooxygenase YgiN/uncharacterized glyoxalase superfamily protein PhnB
MNQSVKHIALVVNDYDEAIQFYTKKLHFTLVEDTKLSDVKRWVVIRPPGNSTFSLLLAKAANEVQSTRVGNQAGGRVFLFMNTDNLDRDYQNLIDHDIKIVRERVEETWGKVAVFADLYGNLWDLIEPAQPQESPFYSTGILAVKNTADIERTREALTTLAIETRNEVGNLKYEVHQSLETPSTFIVWESYTDEAAFKSHLEQPYFKAFMALDKVTLISGTTTNKVI